MHDICKIISMPLTEITIVPAHAPCLFSKQTRSMKWVVYLWQAEIRREPPAAYLQPSNIKVLRPRDACIICQGLALCWIFTNRFLYLWGPRWSFKVKNWGISMENCARWMAALSTFHWNCRPILLLRFRRISGISMRIWSRFCAVEGVRDWRGLALMRD